MATTPPSLLGIDRKIAYAHKKYHSGWMWVGVTKGLAGKKLAGSLSKVGKKQVTAISEPRNRVAPKISLLVYRGWNGTMSASDFRPRGLLDPVSCRKKYEALLCRLKQKVSKSGIHRIVGALGYQQQTHPKPT